MYSITPIGTIHTPYEGMAPFRPDPESRGPFTIEVFDEYIDALLGLDDFSHIIVLFYFDRSDKTNLKAHPPHLQGQETGLFASRSPNRINKIGMDVVRLEKVEGNMIFTSPMDILDGTPLIDIKPYIPGIDSFPEAGSGHLA